jgi:hypothetical protein
MVRLETATGRTLTLNPETIFSLISHDGCVLIHSHLKNRPESLGAFTDPINPDFHQDWRFWYIAGLVFSCGQLSRGGSRTAKIILPSTQRAEIENIHKFLLAYAEAANLRNGLGLLWEVRLKDTGAQVLLATRILDFLLDGPCAGLIEPVTHDLGEPHTFCQFPAARQGFYAGVLAGASATDEGHVLIHKDARVVRQIHDALFADYGVPSYLRINPHEPTVTVHKRRTKNPHSLLIRREHFGFVRSAGLAYWNVAFQSEGRSISRQGFPIYPDRIVSVTPVEDEQRAVEAYFGGALVSTLANFLVKADFEPSQTALDIASMKELFAEVADPEAVLRAAPVLMTHLHGVI